MLFKLLTAPITAPLAGFRFILNQVGEMAERELYDEDRIREELLELQLRLDEGDIDEDEYAEREADVMARLRVAREYRQALGRPPAEPEGPAITYRGEDAP
ncbi:MAG TPA: gas vesicle protein GvpG [Chloroflexota bacterium]|nr:gas vesicle protein GvpG [Chloroflexota bacterium]